MSGETKPELWRRRFEEERDRRYTELRAADQRALQIAEQKDDKALVLAAQLQAEKDERRNDILERWSEDRGTFVTKDEYAAAHQTLVEKFEDLKARLDKGTGGLAALGGGWQVILGLALVAVAIYAALHR